MVGEPLYATLRSDERPVRGCSSLRVCSGAKEELGLKPSWGSLSGYSGGG
jgi:hypothetical protein